MRLGHVTKAIILVAIGVLAIWTTIAAIWGVPGDTVSSHVLLYSQRYPILAFGLGVLVGHWLVPMQSRVPTP